MNRFIVNVAVDGRHYCRIELPEVIEKDAIKKARALGTIFIDGAVDVFGQSSSDKVQVTMTRWNDVGTEIAL